MRPRDEASASFDRPRADNLLEFHRYLLQIIGAKPPSDGTPNNAGSALPCRFSAQGGSARGTNQTDYAVRSRSVAEVPSLTRR